MFDKIEKEYEYELHTLDSIELATDIYVKKSSD